jgi:hypothetical protein
MLSQTLWALPLFLVLSPFNVICAWAKCNHSSPHIPAVPSHIQVPALPHIQCPLCRNKPIITSSMGHSPVPSPPKRIFLYSQGSCSTSLFVCYRNYLRSFALLSIKAPLPDYKLLESSLWFYFSLNINSN